MALAVGQLVSWGSVYYSFSLFVVPMESELGWSKTLLNGALAAGLLTAGLCAYPIGKRIDRDGGRLLMTAGSLGNSLLLAIWSSVEDPAAFYALWFGLGACMAATLYEPVFAVLTRSFHRTFRQRIAATTLIGGFASTVFIPLTQLLIELLGWRDALLALAAINLVICVPIHGGLLADSGHGVHGTDPEGRARAASLGSESFRRAIRHPAFWGLGVSFVFYYATFSALTFHLVPLLAERGLAMALIVGAYTVIGPAQVAGRIVLITLARNVSAAASGRFVVLMFPASVILLLSFSESILAIFGFAALYGAANGIFTIIRGTIIPELLTKEGYGAISGALTLPSNIAKAAAPLLAALIWQAAGQYDAVLLAILAGATLSAIGFWFAVAAGRRRPFLAPVAAGNELSLQSRDQSN